MILLFFISPLNVADYDWLIFIISLFWRERLKQQFSSFKSFTQNSLFSSSNEAYSFFWLCIFIESHLILVKTEANDFLSLKIHGNKDIWITPILSSVIFVKSYSWWMATMDGHTHAIPIFRNFSDSDLDIPSVLRGLSHPSLVG